FDYIAIPEKGFSDNSARAYFLQMIKGLKGIHNAGLAHRDLKTENIWFLLSAGHMGFQKNYMKQRIQRSAYLP
ncbi:MAG: protein kinase family protein, partial [Chitinophagales bacterium]|nr:protein kinase family protein [Chitinophagales bacterium]